MAVFSIDLFAFLALLVTAVVLFAAFALLALLLYAYGVCLPLTFPLAVVLFVLPAVLASGCLLWSSALLVARQPSESFSFFWFDDACLCVGGAALLLTLAHRIWHRSCALRLRPPALATYLASSAALAWGVYAVTIRWQLASVARWRGIVGEATDADAATVRSLVARRSEQYAEKYSFAIDVVKVYKVDNAALEREFASFCSNRLLEGRHPNRQWLFHGTEFHCARRIVSAGFRLPLRAGMFGKGIYFTATPLKALQYTKHGGAILLCEVAMGYEKRQRWADSSMGPESLQRSVLARMLYHYQPFDSITASGFPFGPVRVPESVVYAPEQIVPRYVIFVKKRLPT